MKIVIAAAADLIPQLFSDRALTRISELGELAINTGSAEPDQIRPLFRTANVVITSWGNGPLSDDLLAEAPDLCLVIHAAGSVKGLVTRSFWERGIRLANSAKPLGRGVAETALGFTLSSVKNIYALSSEMHDGKQPDAELERVTELSGLTVGTIGGGWAGSQYIRLLRGFDVEILLHDPYISQEQAAAWGARSIGLHELLRSSDIVSLHAALLPETRGMIRRETLCLMKKDAVLINTANGALIQEQDLYEHMAAGGLKYACLDVFDPEPPAVDHPLRSLPNVIMTPHIAGLANNGLLSIGEHVTSELDRFICGKTLECEISFEKLATIA